MKKFNPGELVVVISNTDISTKYKKGDFLKIRSQVSDNMYRAFNPRNQTRFVIRVHEIEAVETIEALITTRSSFASPYELGDTVTLYLQEGDNGTRYFYYDTSNQMMWQVNRTEFLNVGTVKEAQEKGKENSVYVKSQKKLDVLADGGKYYRDDSAISVKEPIYITFDEIQEGDTIRRNVAYTSGSFVIVEGTVARKDSNKICDSADICLALADKKLTNKVLKQTFELLNRPEPEPELNKFDLAVPGSVALTPLYLYIKRVDGTWNQYAQGRGNMTETIFTSQTLNEFAEIRLFNHP